MADTATLSRDFARDRFFLYLNGVLALAAFSGFVITYFEPMASSGAGIFSPVKHVHGLLSFAWLLLLVIQPTLISMGRVAAHRALGMLGISLASGLLLSSLLMAVLWADQLSSGPAVAILSQGVYWVLTPLICFTVLIVLAIRNVRRPDAHKRYISMATVMVALAGLGRSMQHFGLSVATFADVLPQYLAIDAFVIAMVLYDRRTLNRVHRATLTSAVVNLLPQLLWVPIATSTAFNSFSLWLANLAYFD